MGRRGGGEEEQRGGGDYRLTPLPFRSGCNYPITQLPNYPIPNTQFSIPDFLI